MDMGGKLICKACRLIIAESKLGAVCPACGVPRSAFEAYADPVKPRRRFFIDLNLHPISLHFPQALSLLVPFCLGAGFIAGGQWGARFDGAALILSMLFPLSVLGAFTTGVFDGSMRFKKLRAPYLVRKIFLGASLFMLSVAAAALAFMVGVEGARVSIGAVSMAAVLVEIALAQIGKSLMCAALTG